MVLAPPFPVFSTIFNFLIFDKNSEKKSQKALFSVLAISLNKEVYS